MQETPGTLQEWKNPGADEVGEDAVAFLYLLQQPTWIEIDGHDMSRTRAIVTLLHGNEPSGLKAVHKLITDGRKPATRLIIVIASVNAALYPPLLSHRFLPWEKDLNRCFVDNPGTGQERLASLIREKLLAASPEAIVDTHNTSGHSVPFAVATTESQRVRQLAQMFCHRLVVMDLRLGTLIEQAQPSVPVVTVEFGGFNDPQADQLAEESIDVFATRDNLFATEAEPAMILRHPYRLEIDERVTIHYGSSVQVEADLTVHNTIDQLNFHHVDPGTNLGWLGRGGLEGLHAISAGGENHVEKFFADNEGFLTTLVPMNIFMATTDAFVAQKDCLLYFKPDGDEGDSE